MLRRICNILSTLLLIIMALLAMALLVPNLIGMKSMAVLSGSMEPEIPVGSVVCVREVKPESLEVGDVISYRLSGDTMVTHRIESIDRENQQIVTKGDANETADLSPVGYDRIVGKVLFHLPLLGYISIYCRTKIGIATACGILLVLILLNLLPDVLSGKKEEAVDA
ncbi:MAG: signal peptidase I [Acetatifactor sp.]